VEEEHWDWPNEDIQPRCLSVYEEEKMKGTELPAIIGLLRDYVDRDVQRIRTEREEKYRRQREQDQTVREQRPTSGDDCKWTQVQKSPRWYYRANSKTYRLSATKDKKSSLYRVTLISDNENGALIGKYQRCGDATKVGDAMAYQPEPKW
jgi:hypothetical protein